MNIFNWLKKLTNTFLDSIDTITTKLLILVLSCITIPLIVVGSFSSNIINDGIIQNLQRTLAINKKILEKRYTDEIAEISSSIKIAVSDIGAENIISGAQSSKFVNYLTKKNNNKLSFIAVIDANKSVKEFWGNINKYEVLNKLTRPINIALGGESLQFTESIANDVFQLSITPLYSKDKLLGMVIVGKSLKNSAIASYINNITGNTVIVYKFDNTNAEVISVSGPLNGQSNFININDTDDSTPNGYYFKNNIMLNDNEFLQNIALNNLFNEPVAKIYLGMPKLDAIVWVKKNVHLISIIAIISLVVAIIIAALFARKITDPILALKEAAESINLGNLDCKVWIKGNDETVKLANAFNKMVANLKRDERIRNNFVATLTHDLKVPMLAENQTISFLLKESYGPLTNEQREILELIKSTNSSSLEMIGTLLEVYRYDCGNPQLFKTDFNFVELVHESINQIKSLAEDKKIQVNINSALDNIPVKADKRDIKRLIHNLVSNGINHGVHRGFLNCNIEVVENSMKYAPINDPEYYTTLNEPINLSKCLLVTIEDNGLGIAREDMPLLFKRFSFSKGRKPAGSGLGLYYANQVVKLHGGHIWAESSDGSGTKFKFTLPLNSEFEPGDEANE